ncbi:MAG: amidase [Paracoccaceae bacterium]
MTFATRSATSLLADLASRKLTAEELMGWTLERIAAVNPPVNAIVGLREGEDLMAEARAKDAGPISGPLHGLPIAVKDLVEVKGVRSTHGSPIYADLIPEEDHLLAADLRAAGAILIGKTNVPEFGLGSHTFNPVYGATGNPYAAEFTCGGSSGGAAVALATGMTALADGSDMMGSLRNPAGWCNVYGFRPSWGRVPSEPKGDTFLHQLATLGPMGRSPEDIAVLLDVLSHTDPRQPHGVPSDPIAPLAAADLTGKRIGWLADWGGAYPMEDGILSLCEEAMKVFEAQGAVVEQVPPPFDSEVIWDSWITLRSWQVGAGLAPEKANIDKMKDSARWELERALSMTALDVHQASLGRTEWFKTATQLFEKYDALALPTAQVWPFSTDTAWPTEIAGQAMDTYHRWMEVVLPVSLLGLPSLAMPAGFGANGLPMGVQIFGARGNDASILSLGQAYHQATQWPQNRPAFAGDML